MSAIGKTITSVAIRVAIQISDFQFNGIATVSKTFNERTRLLVRMKVFLKKPDIYVVNRKQVVNDISKIKCKVLQSFQTCIVV